MRNESRLAVLGAGHVGPVIARLAIGAGDDPAAVTAVAELTDRIGYDPVRLGGLPAGRALQPGGPVFGQVLTVPEFERALHEDARSLS